MAQRYGRNQKRAARASIAMLESHLSRDRAALRAAREAESRLQALLDETIERIRRACGKDSGLLPINFAPDVDGYPGPNRAIYPPLPSVWASVRGAGDIMSDTVTYSIETLVDLVLEVERDPRRFQRLIRFFDTSKTGKFTNRYCVVSETMMRTIGWTRRDVDYLAREIAQRLVQLEIA